MFVWCLVEDAVDGWSAEDFVRHELVLLFAHVLLLLRWMIVGVVCFLRCGSFPQSSRRVCQAKQTASRGTCGQLLNSVFSAGMGPR